MIGRLDGNRCNKEDRAEYNQRNSRNHDVQQTFNEQILWLRMVTPHLQHRQVEHVHRIRAGHNGVANAGDNEGSDIVFHAVLQNHIAVMAMNAAHKHRADAVQHGKVRNAFICRCGKHNLVLIVQPILANQFFHTLADVVNHSRCLRRKNLEIRVVRVICPDGCQNHLPDQRRNARQNVGQMLAQQPNHNVHNEIADRHCQELRIDDLGNALHGHQKGIVYAPKDDEQHKEQRHHQIIALCVKWRCNVLCIVQIPA